MDIQRKAFESSNNVNPDWSFKFDEELQQYVATDFEMTNQVDEFNEHWDTFRAGWQAAKAQTDQKIKLLLCDEHLKKCESPTGVFNSQYPDEEPCLICLAKEAKAQAVPKWVSVEDRLPPCDFEFCETGEQVSNVVLIHSAATYGFNMGMGHVNEDGVWNAYSGEHDFMNVLNATHWMPLPDAPQEPAK